MNAFQKRLVKNNNGKRGGYIFYGVPNDEEGQLFMSLFKKYLNKDFSYTRRYRGKGSWNHSISKEDADSFVIYMDIKEDKKLLDIVYKLKRKLWAVEGVLKNGQ
jgi:hypothetical protein